MPESAAMPYAGAMLPASCSVPASGSTAPSPPPWLLEQPDAAAAASAAPNANVAARPSRALGRPGIGAVGSIAAEQNGQLGSLART